MAYILTKILILFAIIQPAILFESIALLRPFLLVSVLAAFFAFFVYKRSSTYNFPENKYLSGVVITHIVSTIPIAYIPIFFEACDQWIKTLIIYFIIAKMSDKFENVKGFIRSCIIGINVHALWALDKWWNNNELFVENRISSYGEYYGANDFSFICVLGIPLVIFSIGYEKKLFLKLLLIADIFLLIYLQLLTKSRGGLLGLLTVIVLTILFLNRLKILKSKASKIILCSLVVLILSVSFIRELTTRHDAKSFIGNDKSAENRIAAMHGGIIMALKNPIIGVGNNQFREHIKEYAGTSYSIAAHNTIIKVAAETGLIGVICYIGMIFVTLKRLWTYIKNADQKHIPHLEYAKAILISLIAFLVCTMFSTKEHEWILYILLATSTYFSMPTACVYPSIPDTSWVENKQ